MTPKAWGLGTQATWPSGRRELTVRGHQGLVVLCAPPHGVEIRDHHVTPEVGPAVLAVATVTQKQQLPTRGDDRGHPVRVGVVLVGHLQLHPWLEVALKTDFNLQEGETQGKCHCIKHIVSVENY